MNKISFLLFFFSSFILLSQQNNQLMEYYNQLKSKGFSDQQIKQLATENGYDVTSFFGSSPSEIQPNQKQQIKSNQQALQSNYSNFSESIKDTLSTSLEFPVYGSQYFNNLNYNFSPQINIATPSNYQLGPGDGIIISLWGASETSYQIELDTAGKIVIDGVGPIFLNGYTITSAKLKIKKALSKIYSGLLSNQEQEKVNIDLSLSSSRSVFVNIVGQVNTPGLYTLNGMSSPIHALYAAGGIADNGSYRDIEIIRNNKVVSKIDLYTYFSSGVVPTLFLRDQDVIRVPFYKNRVTLQGEVKFEGFFELTDSESLLDLINYSGGKSPTAQKDNYLVSRIENSRYKSQSVSDEKFSLISGDKVFVYTISDQQDQRVSIQGEVIIPGFYSLQGVSTIQDLIDLSNGYTKDAYLDYASLFRRPNDKVTQMLSVGLNSNDFDLNLSEQLVERDSLVVYKKEQFLPFDKVTIEGQVTQSGQFDYYSGMSIQDLIGLASGIKSPSENLKVIVKTVDPKSNDYILSEVFESFDLRDLSTTILNPLDIVSVIEKDKVQPVRVSVLGEVKNPGLYVQSKKSSTIKNLIEEAGGLTQYANKSSIYIRRKSESQAQEILKDSLTQVSLDSDQNLDFTFIPIDSIDDSYYFEDGDQLILDQYSNDVVVSGEVLKPSVVKFKTSSLKYYLNKAGLGSKGSKKDILVIYPNKDVSATKRFLFFKNYPEVVPGSEIVVAPKPEREKLSTQEVLGITSGLSTLIIVLSTLLPVN